MWCPDCKTEYNSGESACPNCGASLVEEIAPALAWGRASIANLCDKWIYTESGEPVTPAFLVHCTSSSMEDEMTVNMLDAFGIPAIRSYPNDGSFGRVMLGMSGSGVDLYVPETLIEDARALLSGADVDYDGEDD